MSAEETILRPTQGVVREAFDDEVVIINLDSGTYYSLNGSGVAVWTAIEGGATLETLVALVAARYDADAATIETDVRNLVDRLRAEQLVSQDGSTAPAPATSIRTGARISYEPPQLSVFTDMQELLRLDPVHDVDETGWPHRPKPDSGE